MDAYTLHLLGMAVEACGYEIEIRHFDYETGVPRGFAANDHGYRPTLADALAALLRDMGVEVPERPTAERVDWSRRRLFGRDDVLGDLCEQYRSEPLPVLALLEDGS